MKNLDRVDVGLLVVLAVLVAFVLLSGPPAPSRSRLTTLEAQMFDLVNAARKEKGLAPYEVDVRVQRAATRHADYQRQQGRMTHYGPGWFGTVGSRLTTEGYRWSTCCENVGWYPADARKMFDGWMSSSGHRANILSGSCKHVGIAFAGVGGSAESGRNGYWCLVASAGDARRDDRPDPGPDPSPPDGPGPDPNPYPPDNP